MSARIRRKARSGVYSSTCLMPSTTHCYCCSATRRARTRAHPSNVTRYHRVIKGLFLGADCSPPPSIQRLFLLSIQWHFVCSSHSPAWNMCCAGQLSSPPPHTSGDHKSVRHCLHYVPLFVSFCGSSCICTGRTVRHSINVATFSFFFSPKQQQPDRSSGGPEKNGNIARSSELL